MKLAVFVLLLVTIPLQGGAWNYHQDCKDVDVTVKGGRNFSGDGKEAPDPFIVVRAGKIEQRTREISDTTRPTWNQKMTFHNVNSPRLMIQLWDSDGFFRGGDDHLGSCVKVMYPGTHRFTCDTGDQGSVDVEYTCKI